MPQSNRMTLLQQRATPSGVARGRGTQEHADLLNALERGPRGKVIEPGPDHPLYDDFIRLTEPRPKGRPPVLPQDPESKAQRARETAQRYRQNTWTREQQDRKNQHDRETRARALRVERAKKFYGIQDQDAAEMLADQHQMGGFPPPLTTQQYEEEGKTRWWPYEYGKGIPEGGYPVHDAFGVRVTHVLQRAAADTWEERVAATTPKKKPAKPRKPEEVWYDVHKHPEGVPGGMGKSPEYHLRNRGWQGHEIHSATGKTMQYMHPDYPDFTISFGGATGTKPDHNFTILYMGTNKNIPKKTRAYQPSEAMNKVEQLSKMQPGHVIVPMTHDSAAATTPVPPSLQRNQPGTRVPKAPKPRDMDEADSYPEFPDRPQGVSESWNDRHEKQLQEIPDPPLDHPVKRQASLLSIARRDSWEDS
jgi:hypothetical protein